jgi:hypothetical protein
MILRNLVVAGSLGSENRQLSPLLEPEVLKQLRTPAIEIVGKLADAAKDAHGNPPIFSCSQKWRN